MANEACPHCGAERRYEERYDCGTWVASTDFPASKCYERQLATVTAERDELLSRFRPLPNLQRQSTPTNCFRACVATVLGIHIDDVPTACDGASWDWDEFQRWLSNRGLQAIEVGFGNGGTLYPVSENVPCIVTGQSPRECATGRHAVVGRFIGLAGFELIGDPHPSNLWIDGEPTHAVFFVPLWPMVVAERDELKKQKELDDYHILKLQGVLEGSTKRNRQKRETIKTLQDQVGELQRRIDEAPVICSEGMTENDAYEVVEREWSEHPESTFRLVRDDQPTVDVPESSQHNP